MILDSLLEFANGVSLSTDGAGTYNLGDVILAQPGGVRMDLGNNRAMVFYLKVHTTVTSGGAATVQFRLVANGGANIPTDGTHAATIWTSPAIDLSGLTENTAIANVVLPFAGPLYRRYLGVQYIVGTAALTGGKVSAWLLSDVQNWQPAPRAVG